MSAQKTAMRVLCATSVFALVLASNTLAQQFADPAFRPYQLRVSDPHTIEDSLRRFLTDRMNAGEQIEIVADARAGRLLVRGSDEVQRLTDQFIQAIDLPVTPPQQAPDQFQQPMQVAQANASVRGYGSNSVEELGVRLQSLRQRYGQRRDVRIAPDERTRQLVIHAPADVHQQITANWNNPAFFATQGQGGQSQHLPADGAVPGANGQNYRPSWIPANAQVQLENITWQDLLRGMRPVQGQNAVSSAQDGTLEMSLPSETGDGATQLRIDQENQVVQISGSSEATNRWTRVVQALDSKPENDGDLQVLGRLGSASPSTITRTITMLGGGSAAPINRPLAPQQNAQWGGDVVERMFGQQPNQPAQQPVQLAQADAQAPPPQAAQAGQADAAEITRLLSQDGDGAGSFLGPVRIEFLPGTDIFIVRGQKRDVDRVMQIINNIQNLTEGTEPEVRVRPLKYANSEAIAAVIQQLNESVLQARQGDISVTALVKPNAVLLIGRESGVQAVEKIISELDVEAEATDRFEVISLEYLAAVDAEKTLNYLYVQSVQQQGADAAVTLAPRVRIVADYRKNAIIVVGSQRDVEEIRDLINQIDTEGTDTVAELQVFPLKNAIAEEVVTVLNDALGTNQSQQAQAGQTQGQTGGGGGGTTGSANTQARSSNRAMQLEMRKLDVESKKLLDETVRSGVMSNVVITSNERTNSVVVTAPKGSMPLIAEIIRQLDEGATQEAFVRVFTIVKGDASTLLDMLDTLFPQDDNQNGALVQSAAGTGESTLVPLRFALDPRTNSIIATGNRADLEVVEAVLLTLDASNVSGRRTTVYELANQQATSVATAVTDFVLQRRAAIQEIAPDTLSPYQLIDQEVIVVGDDISNKLIISATDRYYDEVMDLIRRLDKRPEMVTIKALIATVDLNTTEEFGVELGIQDSLLFNRSSIVDGVATPGFNFNNSPLGGIASNPGSARDQLAGQALADLGLGRTNGTLGYGGLVLSASSESVAILVRALQEARRLDILSRPVVTTQNNIPGRISVGQLVPFIDNSQNTGFQTTNSVGFQEVGLTLEVTPRVSPDGLIVMGVGVTNSELGPIEEGIPISVSADGTVIRQPVINQTTAQTSVSARDGQTIILGGLITKSRSAFERKVPYLGDVPFFGKLFRSDGVAEQRGELLIILTPSLIRDEADLNRVNTEEYARMSWCLGNVIETHGDIMSNGVERVYGEEAVMTGIEGDPIIEAPMETGGEVITMPHLDVPNSQVPMNSPVPSDWSPTPSMANPPAPGPAPDVMPQANLPSVLRNAPKSAKLDPSKHKPLFGKFSKSLSGFDEKGGPIAGLSSSTQIRPVGHVDSGNDSATERAIYRFDQIPANE